MPLVDGDTEATVAATAVGLFPGVAVGVLAVLAVPLRFRLRDMTPGALELVCDCVVDGCDTGKHKFQLRVNMLSRHRHCNNTSTQNSRSTIKPWPNSTIDGDLQGA